MNDDYEQAGRRIFELLSRKRALEKKLRDVDQMLELLMEHPLAAPTEIDASNEDEIDTASITGCT